VNRSTASLQKNTDSFTKNEGHDDHEEFSGTETVRGLRVLRAFVMRCVSSGWT
jgi:hypothetical protein